MKTPRPFHDPTPIVDACAKIFGINPKLIFSHSRERAAVCRARQIAMYLTYTLGYGTLRRTAAFYSRHYTTLTHACNLIEDLRDDPAFDKTLLDLESQLVLPQPDSLTAPIDIHP